MYQGKLDHPAKDDKDVCKSPQKIHLVLQDSLDLMNQCKKIGKFSPELDKSFDCVQKKNISALYHQLLYEQQSKGIKRIGTLKTYSLRIIH